MLYLLQFYSDMNQIYVVKLNIMTYTMVVLFEFYVTFNPFKLQHNYGVIGMFWAK